MGSAEESSCPMKYRCTDFTENSYDGLWKAMEQAREKVAKYLERLRQAGVDMREVITTSDVCPNSGGYPDYYRVAIYYVHHEDVSDRRL